MNRKLALLVVLVTTVLFGVTGCPQKSDPYCPNSTCLHPPTISGNK